MASAGCAKRKQSARPSRQGGPGACWTLLVCPSKPSLPGSACPAEATGFTCFFSCFFCFLFFGPKFHPRPSQWPPQGSQNPSKFVFFFNKSVSREPPFCHFLLPTHFSLFFLSILAAFLMKNQCFFCSVFGDVCVFFFNMPTLTIVRKNQYETDFFTFCAFCFFRQKRPKNHPKFQCQKKLGKRSHLAPKIHPKSFNFCFFGIKNCS